jgi:PIN domain nuclease of toxin-antitoxin system
MNLLLDTHVLLWWLAEDSRLSPAARTAIADENNVVMVSAVSIWEIAIKRGLGRLRGPAQLTDYVEGSDFLPLAITRDHAWAAGALPAHHHDPFDRMLVAQARIEDLTIVTADSCVIQYDVPVLQA